MKGAIKIDVLKKFFMKGIWKKNLVAYYTHLKCFDIENVKKNFLLDDGLSFRQML